ncbi:putative F-box protein At1g31090 [Chenopodium quinoa]|uniref:putative F-box protein At1g31090 n=1 Tax=Chenopodium quinoa TaxID=63459 RepID=UPI000B79A7FC|nr:putative F-box protein At1g31090 [Chenopodium quinoa]
MMMNNNSSTKSDSEVITRITLPDQLIADQILSRLPVKPLIRFKCVSHGWLSIISSREFAKTHLQFSLSKPQCLILSDMFDRNNSYGHCLTFDKDYNVTDFVSLENKYPAFGATSSRPHTNSVVDIANGLVCLYDRRILSFHVWNPATNQYRSTGSPVPGYHPGENTMVLGLGFGFISSINDYRIGFYWAALLHPDEVNRSEVKDPVEYYIGGLNLANGKLKRVQLMDLRNKDYSIFKVFQMNGCLTLGCIEYHNDRFGLKSCEFWMLKQHDDPRPWVKLFFFYSNGSDLLHLFESGKCLVSTFDYEMDGLLLHDPSQEDAAEEATVVWRGEEEGQFFYHFKGHAMNYVESLVSPFGTNVFDQDGDAH